MKAKKTHTDLKKIEDLPQSNYSKELLYQLESIVKTIYPKYKTTNPYEDFLQVYYQDLNIEDVLLFKRLLKSVTLMNHKERIQENRTYISSYGDVLTAIELLSQHTINDIVLRSYVQLKEVFRENVFTKLQASRVLRKSMRSITRYLKLLEDLNLVQKTNILQGKKHTYKLLGYHLTTEEY